MASVMADKHESYRLGDVINGCAKKDVEKDIAGWKSAVTKSCANKGTIASEYIEKCRCRIEYAYYQVMSDRTQRKDVRGILENLMSQNVNLVYTKVDNYLFGNPFPNSANELELCYSVNGRSIVTRVNDNDTLYLSYERQQVDVLADLVAERWSKVEPRIRYPDTCVIHIRGGDVIAHYEHSSITDLIDKGGSFQCGCFGNYIQPIEGVKKDLSHIKDLKVLIIGTTMHGTNNPQRTINYVQEFVKALQSCNLDIGSIEVQLDRCVDDDFVLMCKSAYFYPTSPSVFSTLATLVRNHKGLSSLGKFGSQEHIDFFLKNTV